MNVNIKRGAFLLLTAAIAQACSDAAKDDMGAGGSGGSGGSGVSGGSGGKAGSAAMAGNSAAGESAAGQSSQAGAGAGEGGAMNAGGASASDAGAGGEAGGLACDDSVGTPGDCTKIADIANCNGGFEQSYCTAAGTNLKPKVAAAAVSCMLGFSDCNVDNVYTCVQTALGTACPDTTTDAFCVTAQATCNPHETVTVAGCHALVDGLSAAGLASVHSCVESGCTYGLWSCIESI